MNRCDRKKKSFILVLTLLAMVIFFTFPALKTEAADEADETVHEHELEEIAAKAATCTEDGNIACWYCAVCGQYFEDAEGTKEISKEDTVIPAAGHDWEWSDTVFSKTDCQEIDIRFECMRCLTVMEETMLVETVGVDITAHSTLTWQDLVTADELGELFENGAEIDLDLDLIRLDEADVADTEKELVRNKMEELRPGYAYRAVYLDIEANMYLMHEDGRQETRNYTETINPIEITVTIPEELLQVEDTCRVIRIHDNRAEVIDSTEDAGTLTFTSDQFSTYVIAKATEEIQGSETDPGQTDESDESLDEEDMDEEDTDEEDVDEEDGEVSVSEGVDTGDDNAVTPWLVLMLLGTAGIIAAIFLKRRVNQVEK